MLFLGQKTSVSGAIISRILSLNAIALAAILTILSASIFCTVRRVLAPPVRISRLLVERENDLSIRFEEKRRNEVGDVARQLNDYFERLRELILKLKDVSRSGSEVGSALAENSAEVSATVEEISATMHSIRDKIESLSGAVGEARDAVGDIDRKIDDVVDKIEDQSASVTESSTAHAGQYGRGFAVVADEIRKLSEAAAENVVGIQETIGRVSLSIEHAAATSDMTGASITAVIEGIRNIDNAMNEMSQGMSGMSAGTDQVSLALSRLITTSQEIRDSGAKIRARSASIRRSIETVADHSRENVQAVQETARGLGEIMRSMQELSSKGNENTQNIGRLDAEINRFKTD